MLTTPHIATVRRKAWIFRDGAEDGRGVNLDRWSKVDVRYRGVFKALAKCPKFAKGLWEGGSESCKDALEKGTPKAQGHVVYALLDEIGEMLNESRETLDGEAIFYLTLVAALLSRDPANPTLSSLVPVLSKPRSSTGPDIARSIGMVLRPLAFWVSSITLLIIRLLW